MHQYLSNRERYWVFNSRRWLRDDWILVDDIVLSPLRYRNWIGYILGTDTKCTNEGDILDATLCIVEPS